MPADGVETEECLDGGGAVEALVWPEAEVTGEGRLQRLCVEPKRWTLPRRETTFLNTAPENSPP